MLSTDSGTSSRWSSLPCLFILCSIVLSRLLLREEQRGRLKGIKLGCNAIIISHLLFEDDLLLFARTTTYEPTTIKDCLEKYMAWSGKRWIKISLQCTSIGIFEAKWFCLFWTVCIWKSYCPKLNILVFHWQFLKLECGLWMMLRILFYFSPENSRVEGEGSFPSWLYYVNKICRKCYPVHTLWVFIPCRLSGANKLIRRSRISGGGLRKAIIYI